MSISRYVTSVLKREGASIAMEGCLDLVSIQEPALHWLAMHCVAFLRWEALWVPGYKAMWSSSGRDCLYISAAESSCYSNALVRDDERVHFFDYHLTYVSGRLD